MANKSKTTFSLIQKPFILVSSIGNWLIRIGTFVVRVADVPILLYFPFVDRREPSLTIAADSGPSFLWESCKCLLESAGTADAILSYRCWVRHGLPWEFKFLYTLVPGPIPGLSKLQIPLKHRTTSTYNWDLGINVPENVPIIIKACELC